MDVRFIVVLFICGALQDGECVGVFRVAREAGTREDTFFYHVEDGYHYHISSERDGTIYYKCVHYEKGCRGRAIFDPVEGFSHSTPHEVCERDVHYPAECQLRRNILARCRQLEYVPYHRIVEEESRGFNVEVRSRVTLVRLRTSMRLARVNNYPPVPHSLRELTDILIDPQFRVITMSDDGLDNLYGGSVDDQDGGHHVLFVSQRMLQQLRTLNVYHSDGTFKVVPAGPPIAQVFCIVGTWRHHIIPLAWALMESQTEAAYIAVLRLLSNLLGPNIELTRCISDFEMAQQNALERVFRVRVQGCLWHFCRRFLNFAGEHELIRPMRLINEVRRIVRLTMALPLLPVHLIRAGMLLVVTEAMDEGNYIYAIVLPFLNYVWMNWIRSNRRLRRMCVFGSNQRTNNACESHNRSLRQCVGRHPNIFAFIGGLVSLEQRTWTDIHGLQEGRRVGRARRSSSIMNDQRIEELSQDLMQPPGPINQAIIRFLRAASHIMDGLVNEAMDH